MTLEEYTNKVFYLVNHIYDGFTDKQQLFIKLCYIDGFSIIKTANQLNYS